MAATHNQVSQFIANQAGWYLKGSRRAVEAEYIL